MPKPLIGDAKRQATALFKGVDFQIWLTIGAWIDLEENHVLVIEGVEDFDIVKEGGGITTQVKALSQPISLRSQCVVDALRNYWRARHENATRKVEYRFVTTAAAAVEAGAPFGAGVSGLSLWTHESERGPSETTEKLRYFLTQAAEIRGRLEEAFPPDVPSLTDFLRDAPVGTVFQQLISPIRWLTSHDGVESAREAVAMRVHAYGEKMNLMPDDSDRALPHLFEFVAHEAFKQRRVLQREHFRLEFEKAIKPTPREIVNLRLTADLVRRQLGGSDDEAIALLGEQSPLDVPRLPTLCVPRGKLVERITASLAATGFVALHGSTGKGKSTLAKLAVAKSQGHWVWLSLAGQSPAAISARLDRAARMSVSSKRLRIVLDNLDVHGADGPRLARKLAALFLLVSSSGGQMAVTAQRSPTAMFRRETGLPDSVFVNVPNLEKEEVQLLCKQAGCPEGQPLLAHAAIVLAQTGGHPQLANAAVSTRQRRGWPAPTANEIVQPAKEITEERQMARQLLDALEDDDVELLYRLSLLSGFFRRDQAISIGEIGPATQRPGDSFDRLVGPWIEPASGDYFLLSSLLTRAAEENWSKERVVQMRAAIGWAIVRCKKLTLDEAGEVLLQAIATRDSALAGLILSRLLPLPFKHRKVCADALWWLAAFTDPKPIFADNALVNLFLRQMQFRVAAAVDSRQATPFAEMCLTEVDHLISREFKDLVTATATGEILMAIDTLVPPRLLLSSWLKQKALASSSEQIGPMARKFEETRPRHLKLAQESYADLLFGFVLYRRGGGDFLVRLLQAIEELKDGERAEVVASLRVNFSRLVYFIDRVWTDELAKPVRDWPAVIQQLQVAWDSGKRWNVAELIMCAARGIAAIQDEYLNQAKAALDVIEKAVLDMGQDGILLRYQRGTIFSRQGRHQEAYDQWITTLDEWRTDDVESALHAFSAFSHCATQAGHLNRWDDAANLFLRGRGIAKGVGRGMEATAFGVDAAHAFWRAGKTAEALALFDTCLAELEQQAGSREPAGFHTLWKLTEQIIRWCSLDAGATGQKFEMPRSGLCSEPKEEERHQLVKDRPRAPMVLIWYFLAEAEFCANSGRSIFLKMISRPDRRVYPGARAMIASIALRRALKDIELSALPQVVEEIAIASLITQTCSADELLIFAPQPNAAIPPHIECQVHQFAVEAFPTALLVLAAEGKDWAVILGEWRDSAKRRTTNYDFEVLFSQIEAVMRGSWHEAGKTYEAATENRLCRLLGSIRLATCPDSSLAACFVGSVSLVTDEGLLKGMLGAGDALGVLMRNLWRERLKFKAEFSLARISVPAVRAACDLPNTGTKLAAAVLLAAQTAVSTRIPGNTLAKLRELAT